MTSKFKALTGNTPPLYFGENTEATVPPSRQLASTDNTLLSTQTSRQKSNLILTTGKKDLQISEKSRQHAALVGVVLSRLEKAGLIRRFRVLSADQTTVKAIQIMFDLELWTETLELRMLSKDEK